jgi:hypothetical protein
MGIKDTMRGGADSTHAATGRQDFPHTRPVLKATPADEISDDFKAVGEAIKGVVHSKFGNQPTQRPVLKTQTE